MRAVAATPEDQQGCAERIGVPIKFIHMAQILNGAAE
jgi:L-lactate dehydrogenase complex protein LldE